MRFHIGAVLLFLSISPVATCAQTVTIGSNFVGTTSAIQPTPPDTMGAAGIDYFVELNNDEFNIYRKSDGMQVQSKGINQFWVDANTSPLMTPFDPRIVYDPKARRWYAVSVDSRQSANNILFAISSSSDPTQPWSGFSFDSDSNDSNWADFPMLGYNNEGVWISAFMPTLGAAPSSSSFIGLHKFDLLKPVPSTANMVQFEDVPQAIAGTHPQLAIDPDPFGYNMKLLSMSPSNGGSLIQAEVALASQQVNHVGTISVNASQPPSVQQPGAPAVQNLEANDWRFGSNTVQQGNFLWGVQAVEHMSRSAVQLRGLHIPSNSLGGTIIADPTLAFTFPSIAVNELGDIVIGVTGTSTTEFASSYALVRRAGSGVFEPPLLLKAGVDNYERLDSQSRNRWGDYSATTVDPADPSIFWTNQEYVDGTNRWATQVTELILPRPGEARWADSTSGTFDDPSMWLSGNVPQPTDQLVFSRPTNPGAGPFTILFQSPLPGTIYQHPLADVRQGNVRLDLDGNQLDVLLDFVVGPYHGHPQATVANGTLTSVGGLIAPRATSEGHMTLDNAQWDVAADVNVGSVSTGITGLPGEFGGTGSLTIENNAQLTIGNALTVWERGRVNLTDGTLTAPTISNNFNPFNFNFTGGTLHVENFDGSLTNAGGTLAPGLSPTTGLLIGTTDISFDYEQLSSGTLAIDIGGQTQFDFDRLFVANHMNLDGILDVSLIGGFVPSVGDSFDFLDWASLSGVFASISLPTLPGGRRWDLSQLYTTGTLSVLSPFDGDFDFDGDVDGFDFLTWQRGVSPNPFSSTDLANWEADYGMVAPLSAASASVPEPATAIMVMLGMATMLAGRQKSQRAFLSATVQG